MKPKQHKSEDSHRSRENTRRQVLTNKNPTATFSLLDGGIVRLGTFLLYGLAAMLFPASAAHAQADEDLMDCVSFYEETKGEGGYEQIVQYAVFSCDRPVALWFCYRDYEMWDSATDTDRDLARDLSCSISRDYHDPCILHGGRGKCATASLQAWARRIQSYEAQWAICPADGASLVANYVSRDKYTCGSGEGRSNRPKSGGRVDVVDASLDLLERHRKFVEQHDKEMEENRKIIEQGFGGSQE